MIPYLAIPWDIIEDELKDMTQNPKYSEKYSIA